MAVSTRQRSSSGSSSLCEPRASLYCAVRNMGCPPVRGQIESQPGGLRQINSKAFTAALITGASWWGWRPPVNGRCFQGPSCYACSCLSCNFACQPNRSLCVAVTIPSVRRFGRRLWQRSITRSTRAPKVGQRRSSVGAWAIIGTKLRQTRGLPLSLHTSFAELPTLPRL
jgi:hypothetical protein